MELLTQTQEQELEQKYEAGELLSDQELENIFFTEAHHDQEAELRNKHQISRLSEWKLNRAAKRDLARTKKQQEADEKLTPDEWCKKYLS